MPNVRQQLSDCPVAVRSGGRSLAGPLAAMLCVCVVLSAAPAPGAADAESELLRQIEAAQRLEAEAARLEIEAQSERGRQAERERRAISERNAAELRARQENLLQQIDSEFDLQSEMLDRRQRNETATTRDLLGAHAASDLATQRRSATARLAPKAPLPRDLPRSIFSEERVTIPPRTRGFANESKLKLIRLELDADDDGVPEVVRYVDRKTDSWIRQEEDRNYDGTMDAFSRFEAGQLVARALDSNDSGRPDIEEQYADGRMIARTLDRDDDGVFDAFYEFAGRYLVRERHDADNNGEIDLTIRYREGRRVDSEEDTNRDGRSDTWTHYGTADGLETVTQIETDKRRRGFADTFETFEARGGKAILARREEDLDGDGSIDLVSIYHAGKLVRREILKPEVVPL